MEDFGYKSEDEQNYTKNLFRKAVLISLIFFSIFCFLYIGVNAYNYFQNSQEVKTIEPEVKIIKTYPESGELQKDDSKIKIDNSIYEDIFGTRKGNKKQVKIKDIAKPVMPPESSKATNKDDILDKKPVIKSVNVQVKAKNKIINGRKMSRVQLAAMTSKDSAMKFLMITKSKYSNIFSGLDGYIQEVDLGKRGIFFRVQVGDFYDQIRAENFCKKYIAASGKSRSDCIVID